MKKIVIVTIVILIMIFGIVIHNKKIVKNEIVLDESNLLFNDETLKYEVYNENGQVIFETRDKAEAEFFLEHPDYDPMIPDFYDDEENININAIPLNISRDLQN